MAGTGAPEKNGQPRTYKVRDTRRRVATPKDKRQMRREARELARQSRRRASGSIPAQPRQRAWVRYTAVAVAAAMVTAIAMSAFLL